MQILSLTDFAIDAVYACVGDRQLNNADACRPLFGNAVDNIVKATGFTKRCIVSPGVSSLDLCCQAAQRLLSDLKIAPEEIGAIINITFTPENLMPCNACGAQAKLNLPEDVLAFDIGLACSGYCYGLYVAGMLANNTGKKVLLLDGDVQTAYISGLDKATGPIMGDAGSASLISPRQGAGSWHFSFLTAGMLRDVLYIPAGGSKIPITEEQLKLRQYPDGSQRRDSDIHMDGFGVFKFVTHRATELIKDFMSASGIVPEQVDAFVPHQANIYMVRQMGKKLGIPAEKVWLSGQEFGNPSSASVPLTMAWVGMSHPAPFGRYLLSGFGGGMSVSIAYGSIEYCKYKQFFYEKTQRNDQ